MKTYEVLLASDPSNSFRCTKAANSLDINVEKKLTHHLKVEADIVSDFNIGLILGASGSGKTTLAKKIYGDNCFKELLDSEKPIIDQFPEQMSYEDCVSNLNAIGLTHVPCWIRPAKTLSNGQKVRAECALLISKNTQENIVIDEWTSVVDRTVAKVMSHCVSKYARRQKAKIVLLSCHYDVLEWLNPDWVIDCNLQTFTDRRLLCQTFKRTEQLVFEIKEVERNTWKNFSKYHYLSERLPGGLIKTYGLFHEENQIGFQCFANYVPHKKGTKMIMHSNRTVVHPDYAGFGLGIKLINESSFLMHQKGYEIQAKFSSLPVYKAMSKQSCWKQSSTNRDFRINIGKKMDRKKGFRMDITTYSFKFLPKEFEKEKK